MKKASLLIPVWILASLVGPNSAEAGMISRVLGAIYDGDYVEAPASSAKAVQQSFKAATQNKILDSYQDWVYAEYLKAGNPPTSDWKAIHGWYSDRSLGPVGRAVKAKAPLALTLGGMAVLGTAIYEMNDGSSDPAIKPEAILADHGAPVKKSAAPFLGADQDAESTMTVR